MAGSAAAGRGAGAAKWLAEQAARRRAAWERTQEGRRAHREFAAKEWQRLAAEWAQGPAAQGADGGLGAEHMRFSRRWPASPLGWSTPEQRERERARWAGGFAGYAGFGEDGGFGFAPGGGANAGDAPSPRPRQPRDRHGHYAMLGLLAGATRDDVECAFRAACLKHHPDSGGAPEEFRKVVAAGHVLRDRHRKAAYDELL